MHRTTVMLSSNLRNRARAFASKMGISVGKLIRESLEEKLHLSRRKKLKADPFFGDVNYFNGSIQTDLSVNHDEF